MSKLIYFMATSLDWFISDEPGDYEWSSPDEEVMAFINALHRPIGTYLYGRKNYETMAVWQTPDVLPNPTPAILDFGSIWQAADKIVYSTSLAAVSTPKTRLERAFDVDAVRALKATLPHDITISGPTLAAQAIRAGLVDEYQLLIVPVLRGRGMRILPDDVSVPLELLDHRRVGKHWAYLHYRDHRSQA